MCTPIPNPGAQMEVQDKVRRAFVEAFPGIDSDVLEYLCNVVCDLDSLEYEALVETVQPFVESYGLVEDPNQIPYTLHKFSEELTFLMSGESKKSDEPLLLDKPVSMSQLAQNSLTASQQQQIDSLWGFDKVRSLRNDVMEVSGPASKKLERRIEQEQRKWLEDLEKQFSGFEEDGEQISTMMLPDFSSGSNEKDIHVHSFSMFFGGQELLDNADLRLVSGRRYGLIGRNGIGKTTLLRHIAQFEIEGFPRHHRVLHVKQEVRSSSKSVLEVVLSADIERSRLLEQEQRLLKAQAEASDANTEALHQMGSELAVVYERMNIIGAQTAEGRAAAILSGLQFSQEMQASPTDALSGGWRMRVALAGALFIEPDLLMLDEPTNHLDLEAVLWLQEYLKGYKNTVIVVSHDREFLNEVATDVIHFHNKKLTYYRGNYNAFESTRAELMRNHQRLYEAQLEKKRHMQEFVDKFRYNAKRASLVQSRIKAIEKLEEEAVDEIVEETSFRFRFADPGEVGTPVIQIEGVTFGYKSDRPLFTDVHFSVDLKSRIGVLGPNGAGKSTLLNVIQGKLTTQGGYVHINSALRIASFSQHHIDSFDLRYSAVQNLTIRYPQATEADLRGHLGRFQMSGDDAMKPMKFMSGGQKSRVAFALLTYGRPHVVIMDEPTNHLDMDAIEALIEALQNYAGGVMVVSHDQHFITSVCNDLWVVGGGNVTRFNGSFEDYKAITLERHTQTRAH